MATRNHNIIKIKDSAFRGHFVNFTIGQTKNGAFTNLSLRPTQWIFIMAFFSFFLLFFGFCCFFCCFLFFGCFFFFFFFWGGGGGILLSKTSQLLHSNAGIRRKASISNYYMTLGMHIRGAQYCVFHLITMDP